MSIIELSQLGQYLFDFSDLKCLQTKLNYIDKFKLECKIELKCQFAIELSTAKKFNMYP